MSKTFAGREDLDIFKDNLRKDWEPMLYIILLYDNYLKIIPNVIM